MAGTRSTGEPASAVERHAWLPFHVMAKPIGPICNLDCSYCFYLDKRALYPETRSFRMSPETLERFVQQTIAAAPPGAGEVQFTWQGGEPTLMGVGFFEHVLTLQARHAPAGLRVENALQTNATLLDDAWGALLAEHDFLVGVSVDGPRAVHDLHRPDTAGRGSFDDVLRGIDVLKRHGVSFNTLTVLHGENSDDPVGLYDFLKQLGSTHLQFIPVVEHGGTLETVGPRSIAPRQWGGCLNGLFDRWLACGDVGRIFVQHFDVMLGVALGHESAHCVHQERCGRALALEHNGDLYSCDHFVEPAHRLGNLAGSSLLELVESPAQQAFGDAKRDTLPRYCLNCSHLRYCWGACPKDRIARTPDGEAGLHYLCEGYKQFYAHTRPVFERMAEAVRSGRPARDWRAAAPPPAESPAGVGTKVGRNTPCPCGSGLKFKRCCGR